MDQSEIIHQVSIINEHGAEHLKPGMHSAPFNDRFQWCFNICSSLDGFNHLGRFDRSLYLNWLQNETSNRARFFHLNGFGHKTETGALSQKNGIKSDSETEMKNKETRKLEEFCKTSGRMKEVTVVEEQAEKGMKEEEEWAGREKEVQGDDSEEEKEERIHKEAHEERIAESRQDSRKTYLFEDSEVHYKAVKERERDREVRIVKDEWEEKITERANKKDNQKPKELGTIFNATTEGKSRKEEVRASLRLWEIGASALLYLFTFFDAHHLCTISLSCRYFR